MIKIYFLVFILACCGNASARVFSYQDAILAPYVRGSAGLSRLKQDAFANSNGDTAVDGSSRYQYGGELGLMVALSTQLHLRVGAEILRHSSVRAATGANDQGDRLYTLDSTVLVFNPNAVVEYVNSGKGNLRYFAELGVGMANVAVVNTYRMTSAGASALHVTDFDEKMDANVLSGVAGLGLEVLFTDNVTFLTDFGYRYLRVNNLKHKGGVKNIVEPSGVKAGEPATNMDGSKRALDLGGVFVGAAFRFYLNFL